MLQLRLTNSQKIVLTSDPRTLWQVVDAVVAFVCLFVCLFTYPDKLTFSILLSYSQKTHLLSPILVDSGGARRSVRGRFGWQACDSLSSCQTRHRGGSLLWWHSEICRYSYVNLETTHNMVGIPESACVTHRQQAPDWNVPNFHFAFSLK